MRGKGCIQHDPNGLIKKCKLEKPGWGIPRDSSSWFFNAKMSMKFILAKKMNMTSHFLPSGNVVPVTVLKAGPVVVTQVKNLEKDKYQAVQIGFGRVKKQSKALAGHTKTNQPFEILKEFRVKDLSGYEVGNKLDVAGFQVGEIVDVVGVMKGRGFAGAVKRHGFHGMPASHGHDKPRAVGSIGSRFPQHTRRGQRMAGRMGGTGVTVKNLQIIDIDPKRGLMAVNGAVPGRRDGIVSVVSKGEVRELEPKVVEKKEKKK